jgi:hypothetical protein
MRVRLDEADRFKGLPRGTAKPFEFLTAFEQAEPYLGSRHRTDAGFTLSGQTKNIMRHEP